MGAPTLCGVAVGHSQHKCLFPVIMMGKELKMPIS